MCQCDTDAPTPGHCMRENVSLHVWIQKVLSGGGGGGGGGGGNSDTVFFYLTREERI